VPEPGNGLAQPATGSGSDQDRRLRYRQKTHGLSGAAHGGAQCRGAKRFAQQIRYQENSPQKRPPTATGPCRPDTGLMLLAATGAEPGLRPHPERLPRLAAGHGLSRNLNSIIQARAALDSCVRQARADHRSHLIGGLPDQAARIISAAFSPIIRVGAVVLPPIRVGMIEASTTRRPSRPCTRSRESTTAIASLPILQVPTG
jgi:hypothetical protein